MRICGIITNFTAHYKLHLPLLYTSDCNIIVIVMLLIVLLAILYYNIDKSNSNSCTNSNIQDLFSPPSPLQMFFYNSHHTVAKVCFINISYSCLVFYCRIWVFLSLPSLLKNTHMFLSEDSLIVINVLTKCRRN